MRRPSVAIISRIAGLREALQATQVSNLASIAWIDGPLDAPAAQRSLEQCEILLGEPSECGKVVDRCRNLLWLQSTWAGCNPLLTASTRRDYVATRLAGCFGPDMAEYAALHILAIERRHDDQRRRQAKGEWVAVRDPSTGAQSPGADYRRLSSLTLGVLGLGEIGSSIAATCSKGLNMRVVGCRRDASPRPSDEAAGVSRVYPLARLSDFLSASDYIVSVLPSTPETVGLLDGHALAPCAGRSARGVCLINVGRGDLLSEHAIVQALKMGWLSRYVGDVFDGEPLRADSPLWTNPRVTITCHNAAVSQPEDVAKVFSENLHRYVGGGEAAGGVEALRYRFDWEAGY